jgi:uncharacterized protein
MSKIIEIVFNKVIIEAQLNDSATAQKVLKVLPIKSDINLWGNEIYFEIDVKSEIEDGKELMDIGDIAFWPPGNAFCIFFGPTPASIDTRPRAASAVTVIGKITDKDSIEKIKKIKSTDIIEIRIKRKN